MRLIDADAMNEKLFYKQLGGKDTLITAECAFNMIKAQPTAYDVEKVEAELEQTLGNTNFEKATSEVNESYYDGLSYAYGDSIDMVRKGYVE